MKETERERERGRGGEIEGGGDRGGGAFLSYPAPISYIFLEARRCDASDVDERDRRN